MTSSFNLKTFHQTFLANVICLYRSIWRPFSQIFPTEILYINVILKRIYDDELINTDLQKNKNYKRYFLKDCFGNINPCYGLAQHFRDRIFKNVKKLTTTGLIKLYCRYIDDTLLLMIPADLPHTGNLFNKFEENLWFIILLRYSNTCGIYDWAELENMDKIFLYFV